MNTDAKKKQRNAENFLALEKRRIDRAFAGERDTHTHALISRE